MAQIAVAGRFQEPISLEKWAAGEIYSTPVNLSNIDRVPVSIVHAIQDESCDPTMIEWTYAQMQQEEKFIRFEHGGHTKFALASSDDYVQRMVETIDYGTTHSFAAKSFTLSISILSTTLLLTLCQYIF